MRKPAYKQLSSLKYIHRWEYSAIRWDLLNGSNKVGGGGLVVPSWLAVCWVAQGSGFESQRRHLFFGIYPRGEISQEGFVQGWFPLLPQVDI
jgi:hypothetical protein